MIVFTLIWASVTLMAVAAQYVSPSKSFILPFIALSLSFLLIGDIVLMLYWIVRLKVWFIVPLFAIACNYQYLGRIFRLSSTSSTQLFVNVLKIATFNADSFGKEWTAASTKEFANYMNRNGVDVLCFQEFGFGSESFPIDSIYRVFQKWPYHCVPISPVGHDCLQLAVFSKYPIKNDLLMTFKDTPNCALWCDINMNGKMVRLFNLHLQTTNVSSNMTRMKESMRQFDFISGTYHLYYMFHDMQESFVMRAKQADYIHSKIKESPYPVILCGDFNSLPSSYTYHAILGNELKDGFCLAGRRGYMYTFRYLKHLFRIDYIMTSSHWKALDYYSPHIDFHSDHNPVIMAMKIN